IVATDRRRYTLRITEIGQTGLSGVTLKPHAHESTPRGQPVTVAYDELALLEVRRFSAATTVAAGTVTVLTVGLGRAPAGTGRVRRPGPRRCGADRGALGPTVGAVRRAPGPEPRGRAAEGPADPQERPRMPAEAHRTPGHERSRGAGRTRGADGHR